MKHYLLRRVAMGGEVMYLSTIYSDNKFDWTTKTAFAHRFVSVPLANKWLNKMIAKGFEVELVEVS